MKYSADFHKCELDQDREEELLHLLPPTASSWAKRWEAQKFNIIVSPNHPFTKDYFRSQAAIYKERSRHMLNPKYRRIIHPFSNVAIFRSIFMCVLFTVLFFMDPLYCTLVSVKMYKGVPFTVLDYVQLMLNLMVIFDIVINFYMGYAIEQSREVVLEPRLIALRYLKTYFIVDVLVMLHSVIPLVVAQTSTIAFFSKMLVVARLARFGSINSYLSFTLKLLFKMEDTKVLITQMIFSKTVILHWWACYLAVLPTITRIMEWTEEFSWKKQALEKPNTAQFQDHDISNDITSYYLECLLIIMCHFYGAGHATYTTFDLLEMTMLSCVILSGVCFSIYAIAVVSEAFGTVNISTIKYEEMISQVNEYVTTKKLPPTMVSRLQSYYEYKFQRRFFWEHAILNSLSEHLQMEVLLYSCKHLIEKVDIFRGMTKAAVGTIISMLRQEIYLPGDKVYNPENAENKYYHLISYGTMAVYLVLSDDVLDEFGHFEDGDHLDDSNELVRNVEVGCETIAIEICEIYSITREDMAHCFKMFPELKAKMRSIMRGRLDHLQKMLAADRSTHQDILTQLQSGKILEIGKMR